MEFNEDLDVNPGKVTKPKGTKTEEAKAKLAAVSDKMKQQPIEKVFKFY